MSVRMSVVILIGLVAAIEDIARRRVSNWIPVSALLAGVIALSIERGWRGALSAAGGAVAGFLIFFVFYWLGGMGGGDVKLMAGMGAVLGVERLLEAALWTAGCGGLFAMIAIVASSLRRRWTRSGTAPAPARFIPCLLYTSPSPRDRTRSRMPSSA